MTYQISYFSPQGHARELAYSFRRILPSRTPVVDLSRCISNAGRIHLIGFEYLSDGFEEIPGPVQCLLDQLEGKDILLFATCPLCVDRKLQETLDRSLLSRIPAGGRYHGLYLCQGEVYINILEDVINLAVRQGDAQARDLLRQYRKGRGHPNREDIRKGYRFISASLPLEEY